jgi:hypothetical protein
LEKVRDLNLLAEKLGCSLTQLSIAWTLKHEPVQCLLISAKTTEQLTQNLQALQVKKKFRFELVIQVCSFDYLTCRIVMCSKKALKLYLAFNFVVN